MSSEKRQLNLFGLKYDWIVNDRISRKDPFNSGTNQNSLKGAANIRDFT